MTVKIKKSELDEEELKRLYQINNPKLTWKEHAKWFFDYLKERRKLSLNDEVSILLQE